MQLPVLSVIVSMGLAAAAWSQPVPAPVERDFIFTDDEGHLVLRFAGSGPQGPDAGELEEVVNQSFSNMIHDHLRADLIFEAERVDPEWAPGMEARIESHLGDLKPLFSAIDLQCRSASCRLVMDHTERRSVAEHQALVDIVQSAIEPLTRHGADGFAPIFLIAAYEQQFEMPQVKVYLRRAAAPDHGRL
jgi:hypothetical protein